MHELRGIGEIRAKLERKRCGGDGFLILAKLGVDGGVGIEDRGIIRIGGFSLEQRSKYHFLP